MIRAYVELFRLKPIPLIVAMVMFAHYYALQETGLGFEWIPAILLFLTTGLANGAVFALNQYYEKDADARMVRTRTRPIPSGRINPKTAFRLGLSIFILSILLQAVLINSNTAMATFLCGAVYVWAYTPMKNRTGFSTLVGSLPGAILPFIGWYSVTQGTNLMIVWMSIMIFLWQTPHTFVIVFRHRREFESAGGKQMEIIAGEQASIRQSVWYTAANFPLILIPVVFNVSGSVYLTIAFALSALALIMSLLFYRQRTEQSAKRFFLFMLSYLPVLFVVMTVDRL